MTVYGVFYKPDFNEELYSLHMTEEGANKAVDKFAYDCYGPWTPDSGWDSAEAMRAYFCEGRDVRVKPVEVKE